MPANVDREDARAAFLAGLIDDAGLFPPARLPMDAALAAHRATKVAPYGWAVSRFGCPASRLGEIAAQLPGPAQPLRLSVVLDGKGHDWLSDARSDVELCERFECDAAARARVELLELPLPAPAEAATALRRFVAGVEASRLRGPVQPVFEVIIPQRGWRERISAGLAALGELRAERAWRGTCRPPAAKIRCGGLTADAFPSVEQLAAFIATATQLGVPFKATAGLHQPFRHVAADTAVTHHGFLNVTAASVFAHAASCDELTLRELLADTDPAHFSLTRDGLRWRELVATAEVVAAAREHALIAYGSCSTQEPLEELEALGALPADALEVPA
jgi:hypothetical protein